MYDAIFFDIDNTLLLKKPSIPEKVHEAVGPGYTLSAVEKAYAASELWQGEQVKRENETGVRMPDEEFVANVAGCYRKSLGLSEEAFSAVTQVLARDYKKEYVAAPGARELLDRLKELGVKLGIISNHHTGVRAVLEDMGMAKYFEPIIISEEVGLNKPDAAIMELACERAGSRTENSLYVGDHPFDILCGHAAGMQVVWLPVNPYMQVPEFIGAAEYTADSLFDVLKFIINEMKKG